MGGWCGERFSRYGALFHSGLSGFPTEEERGVIFLFKDLQVKQCSDCTERLCPWRASQSTEEA